MKSNEINRINNTISQLKNIIVSLDKDVLINDELNIILELFSIKFKDEKIFFLIKDSSDNIIYPKDLNVLKKITNILSKGTYYSNNSNSEIYDDLNNKYYKLTSSTHVLEINGTLEKFNIDFIQDISKEKFYEKESKTDYMTDTYNLRAISSKIDEYIIDGDNIFTIVMCDIDKFKNINDLYTHEGGNKVLKKITSILKKYTCNIGEVGRYGGDEFILLLKINSIETLNLIKRIITDIQYTDFIFDNTLIKDVSVSFGICEAEPPFEIKKIDDIIDIRNDIIKKADEALYNSKENGRNQASIYVKKRI